MFEKFTHRAEKVIRCAREEAQRSGWESICTEHLLLGILLEGGGVAAKILNHHKIDLSRVRATIEALDALPPTRLVAAHLSFSARAERALGTASAISDQLGFEVIGTETLLMGLLEVVEGVAADVITALGVHPEKICDGVLEILGVEPGEKNSIFSAASSLSVLASQPRFQHLVIRPSVQDPLLDALRKGQCVGLVGPSYSGKTSAVLGMAREKTGGFDYRKIDYRLFDKSKVSDSTGQPPRHIVHFAPEAELFVGKPWDYVGELTRRRTQGEQLMLEFREGGLESLAGQCPDLARDLVRVEVVPPGSEETAALLHAVTTEVRKVSGLEVSEEILSESIRLAREQLPGLRSSWGSVQVLWEAVLFEQERVLPEEVYRLNQQIKALERDKDEAIACQEFERAANSRDKALELKRKRDGLGPVVPVSPSALTLEAVRLAVEKLTTD